MPAGRAVAGLAEADFLAREAFFFGLFFAAFLVAAFFFGLFFAAFLVAAFFLGLFFAAFLAAFFAAAMVGSFPGGAR